MKPPKAANQKRKKLQTAIRVDKEQGYKKAYKMFLQNVSVDRAAKAGGISSMAVRAWIRKYGWEKDRAAADKAARKEIIKAEAHKKAKYILKIDEVQEEIARRMTTAETNSYESLLREMREFEKLKILKSGGATERMAVTAEEMYRAKKNLDQRGENEKKKDTDKKADTQR